MNKKVMWVVIAVIVLALGGVVIAMQKSSDNTTATSMDKNMSKSTDISPAPTATNSVNIESYAFTPADITVKKGTTVTWTNKDSVEHTVTVDGGSGPKSELFGKDQTYSYTFNTIGSFPYHCQPHPYMKGTVTVTE